jgi:hypothetical protein
MRQYPPIVERAYVAARYIPSRGTRGVRVRVAPPIPRTYIRLSERFFDLELNESGA